jgi:hypothetical protein
VKSPEFAEYFAEQCSNMLDRKPTKVQGPYSDGCYVSRFSSVDFYDWWTNSTFEEIAAIARAFPQDYLRGRYDSESGVGDYAVYMFGAVTHREVLELDRELCLGLGMRTGPILPYGDSSGSTFIHGREVFPRVQKLRFTVNARDLIAKIGRIIVKERDDKLRRTIKSRRWTPWEPEIRTEALKLLAGGLNPKAVSEMMNQMHGERVPPMTIYFWAKGTQAWGKYLGDARSMLKG